MAGTVDERIVEAKFDSSDFEKGVDKTIKKLDELKQSLSLKDAGKNIAEFAKDTSENVEKAGNALEKLSERFATFKGMIKQQILGGLANEISQVFLSIEQGIVRFAKSISSEQVRAGMTKYTEILNSVRTMTAAGVDDVLAYDKIKRLQEYSDQTSYSLSQMASGMSKLVAAGADISKAEKMMEGLANMAASAGVNIYDANRAFTNMVQAYSSKKMRVQDWQSLESLNMATESIMKLSMDAAVAVGTLEKTVDKSGNDIYKTTKKAGKAGKEVSTKGYRDALKYDWFTDQVMETWAGEMAYFEELGININELSEDELNTFAAKAFQAAKEARSFADVMGTVKDVVATGWATSFELIFGKLEKATEFFTWLSESHLAEAIYSIGEFRNAVLTAWGADYADNGIFKKGQTGRDMLLASLKNIDAMFGKIQEGLQSFGVVEYNETLGRFLTFPEVIGKKLGTLSKDFNIFTVNAYNGIAKVVDQLVEMYTEEKEIDGETQRVLKPEYAERLARIRNGISAVFGILSRVGGIISETFGKVFIKLLPIFDAVIDALGKIFDPLVNLNADTSFFDGITKSVDNLLKVLDPLVNAIAPVISFLGDLGGFFVGMAIDTIQTNIEIFTDAIRLIFGLFGGSEAQEAEDGVSTIERWGESLKAFADTCREGLGAIANFFSSLFTDLLDLFGLGKKNELNEGGFFENIGKFFETNEFVQTVKQTVEKAISDVKEFVADIPNKIKNLGLSIGSFFHSLFYTDRIKFKNGQELKLDKEIPTRLKRWLDNAITNVKKFVKSIPGKLAKVPSLIGSFFHGLLYTKKKKTDANGKELNEDEEVPTALKEWFDKAKDRAYSFIQSIPGRIASIPSAIGSFLHSLFYKKETNQETGEVTEVPTALGKWLENAKIKAREFILAIPDKIANIPSLISTFIDGLLNKEETNPETGETTKVRTALGQWLDNAIIAVQEFIAGIPNKIANIPSLISKFIHGLLYREETNPETGETTEVRTALGQWLDNATLAVEEFIADIPNKIKNIPSLISKFIHGLLYREETNPETGETTEVRTALGQWLDNAVITVQDFIADIPNKIKNIPSVVSKFVNSLLYKEETNPETGETTLVQTALGEWLEQAKKDAEAFVLSLPGQIKEWSNTIHAKISSIWNQMLDLIFGTDSFDQGMYDSLMEQDPTGYAATQYKRSFDNKEDAISESATTMIQNIGRTIGQELANLPTHIAEGFQFKAGLLTDLLDHATSWLKNKNEAQKSAEEVGDKTGDLMDMTAEEAAKAIEGSDEASPFMTALTTVGSTLSGLITTTIPAFLTEAFEFVGSEGAGWWEELRTILNLNDFDWSDVETGARNIGTTIAGYIEEIPGIIRGAVGSIKTLFTQKSPLQEAKEEITKQFTDQDGNIVDPRAFHQAMKNAEATLSDETPGKGILDGIKAIGVSIGDAFVDLGPDILAGLDTAMKWLDTQMTNFTQKLAEKPDDQPFFAWLSEQAGLGDETSGIASIINSIGETFKRMITTTIPNFISEGFSEVIAGIPRLLTSLFGGEGADQMTEGAETLLDEASDKISDKTEEAAKNVQGSTKELQTVFAGLPSISDLGKGSSQRIDENGNPLEETGNALDSLFSVFNNITEPDTMKIVAIAAGLYAINKILDNLIIIDEPGWVAKWEAIKIAIMGIVGLIGYLVVLSETGNEEQLEKVKGVFDKLVSLFDRIAQVLTVMKTLNLGRSIANAFGGDTKTGSLLKSWGAILGGVTVVGVGGDVLTESISSWSTNLAETFESIGIGMDDLVKTVDDLAGMNDKIDAARDAIGRIGELFQALREMFVLKELVTNDFENLDVGDSMDVETFFLENGKEVFVGDDDTLHDASELTGKMRKREYVTKSFLDEFLQITRMFSKLSSAIAMFKEAITFNDKDAKTIIDDFSAVMDLKDKMSEFGEFGKTENFTNFKMAFTSLGSAMSLFRLSNFESITPGADWISKAAEILTQVFGNDQLQELVSALSTDLQLPTETEALENFERISIFAGGLASIAESCKDLDENAGENITKLFNAITGISLPKSDKVSDLALQFGEVGNALGSFAASTEDLNDTNIKNAQAALDMLLQIAVGLGNTPSTSVLAKIFTGDKGLENFGIGIEALGGNLKVFFEKIQNLDINGKSVEYNRKNLEQALLAVDSLTQSALRIANGKYVSTNIGDAKQWLSTALGDLSGMGTSIMTFINEINSFRTTDNKPVNFQFVYSAINAIGQMCDIIAKMPNYGDQLSTRIQNVGEILLGNGSSHNGIMGYLNGFFSKVIDITKRDNAELDIEATTNVITAYSEMVRQIVALLKEINGTRGDVLGVTGTKNPMDYLIPVFESVNGNYYVFEKFLNNASKFNQTGIESAKGFFDAIYSLAQGLTLFSKQDKNGDFNVLTGLSTLIGFNWTSLASVKDNMTDIFGSDDFYTVGKTAGSNLDSGMAEGLNTGAALTAAQALAESIQAAIESEDIHPKIVPVIDVGEDALNTLKLFDRIGTGVFHFDTTGLNNDANAANPNRYGGAPDYTDILNGIQATLSGFNSGEVTVETSLEGVTVVMDTGAIVGALIGEIDQRLGRLGFYAGREG